MAEKTVIITGASGGIGAAASLMFAKNGYNVIINYNKNESAARKIEKTITDMGASAYAVQADISVLSDIRRLVSVAEYKFGTVDALVNNAGISQRAVFDTVSEEAFDSMFNTCVKGAFFTSQAVLPIMRNNGGGKIVNVSSMWGVCGAAAEVAYSSAKAALIGFTKALAKEAATAAVNVNCVAPGFIDTKMNDDISEEDARLFVSSTPLCRKGTPQEVAALILYLCSKEASFITGQIFGINGGAVI